jgi:glutamate synthase domain-containing protein 3
VRELLEAHRAATGSRKARALLQRFAEALACFRRVAPKSAAAAESVAADERPIDLAAIV